MTRPYHCLAEIAPLDPATGKRVTVRLASANLRSITGLGGVVWEPAMTRPPTLSIGLFEGDFSSPVRPGSAGFAFRLAGPRHTISSIDRLYWAGAAVTIYAGQVTETWPWRVFFAGRVSGFDRSGDALSLSAEVDGEPFEKDILTATYSGEGDAEGGEDLENRVKPLVVGWAQNVEPLLIDAVENVYQFSAYGPIEDVTVLYERASPFADPVDDYADYDALVAADIDPGQWGTCLAEGMIRLGAPAYGVITGDVKGHAVGGTTPRLTGAVIALLADLAGVDPDLLVMGSLDRMDRDRAYPVNLVLASQERFIDLARRMALPLNYQAGIGLAGKFFVTRPDLDAAAALSLHGMGRLAPPVKRAEEKSVSPPYAKTIMGAARNWRVQVPDEIANYDDYDDIVGPAETVIECDYTGAAKTNEINPRYVQFQAWRDGIDATTQATWSVTVESGTITAAISNTDGSIGQLNITAISTDAVLLITAMIGNTTKKLRHTVKRALDPTPSGSGGGSSANGTINGSVASSTMVALSDEISVVVGSGGQVNLTSIYYFQAAVLGEPLYCRWYRWNGAAFVAIGSEVQSTDSTTGYGYTDPYTGYSYSGVAPGGGQCNFTDTGRTPAATERYKLYARGDDANSRTVSGSVSGVGG